MTIKLTLQSLPGLVQLIKRERLHSKIAIVCAPRRYVAFKLLTMPNVSDNA